MDYTKKIMTNLVLKYLSVITEYLLEIQPDAHATPTLRSKQTFGIFLEISAHPDNSFKC